MADQQPRTRQELYEIIRQTSKQEFILDEMKRLGFWDTSSGVPKLSEELIQEQGGLQRELQELMRKRKVFDNKEKLLKEMRQKRMAEAKARREETKKRREELRQQKAAAWQEKKKTDIIYLGQGYSEGLNNTQQDEPKLKALGLPIFKDIPALAEAMGLTIGQLRFLAYTRKVSQTSHYVRFTIPKKSGKPRRISAPMPHLKNAQHWILQNILYQLSIHGKAHGFVPQKSIITNARMHLGQEFMVNIDLQDFFPTITYKRVKGIFMAMGYSEQMSIIFALLCTEPHIDEVELDGERYFVANGERFLPQGAPTSPSITNIICTRMDKRMEGTAQKLGFTYSRYADDMTFSMPEAPSNDTLKKLMWGCRMIVKDEHFTIHPDKVHIMRKGSQKMVTGIVVNEKLSVPRKKLKAFRAVLHQIGKNKSLEGIRWGDGHPVDTILGFANFVRMVDQEKGSLLMAQAKALFQDPQVKASADALAMQRVTQHKVKPSPASSGQSTASQDKDGDGEWWSIW